MHSYLSSSEVLKLLIQTKTKTKLNKTNETKLKLKIFWTKKDVAVGDHVGVGYFIDSCLKCEYCQKGTAYILEQ